MGRLDEAEQARRRAIEIQDTLASTDPMMSESECDGGYLSNLAETLIAAGQLTEARSS